MLLTATLSISMFEQYLFFTMTSTAKKVKKVMYQIVENKSELFIQKLVDKIIASGKMNRQDYSLLTSTIIADGEVSDIERRQINRIFDYIQTGRLKLVDW